MIDLYCERTDPSLWAEPLNAASNLAFFVAAALLWRHTRSSRGLMVLVILIALIGIGSTLFHTFANSITLMADVIPILLFQVAFLFLYAHDALRPRPRILDGLMAVFIVATLLTGQLPAAWLNGSLGYLPALLFLLLFAAWRHKAGLQGRNYLLLAALVFTVSLTFRSLDNAVCDVLPIGLHYFWHILNACVLYLCCRAYAQDKAN